MKIRIPMPKNSLYYLLPVAISTMSTSSCNCYAGAPQGDPEVISEIGVNNQDSLGNSGGSQLGQPSGQNSNTNNVFQPMKIVGPYVSQGIQCGRHQLNRLAGNASQVWASTGPYVSQGIQRKFHELNRGAAKILTNWKNFIISRYPEDLENSKSLTSWEEAPSDSDESSMCWEDAQSSCDAVPEP